MIPRDPRPRKLLILVALAALGVSCRPPLPTRALTPPADTGDAITILISLDGFRWDYVAWPEATHVRALAARGVRAKGLIPAFPSKTFPSHYTTVTGLHPGNHGIISNNMVDPTLGSEFHLGDRGSVEDSRWWGGEPIWVTAEKAGLVAAAMFWPGTETEIAGIRPTYWHRWNEDFAYRDRVAQVLAWLDLPREEQPRLITLYFQDPNDTSHDYGPKAPETRAAVREVDQRLGDLLAGIAERGLETRVNVIVTSDHGMAAVDPERVVVLDDYVTLEESELFESGAFLQIVPGPGREAILIEALRGAHPRLAVYRKDEVPGRFHLGTGPRVAPIIGIPDVGWYVATRDWLEHNRHSMIKGDHGQDPADPRMHGIFVASGPAFRAGVVIDRFASVEVYNVLARTLGLTPAPNDGTPGKLDHIFDGKR